jgi:multiple antibiotic resistance protein
MALNSSFWIDFATVLTTINPPAVVPLYLSLTKDLEQRERARVLRKGVLVAAVILLSFIAIGELILNALGVTLDAFRIAGGMVLMMVGLNMVFQDNTTDEQDSRRIHHTTDIAVFPLAMPFLAGSGAILAVVLLTQNDVHGFTDQAGTGVATLLVLFVCYLILRGADAIQRSLGKTGIAVMAKISGLVITALATQVMITGLSNAFPGLVH